VADKYIHSHGYFESLNLKKFDAYGSANNYNGKRSSRSRYRLPPTSAGKTHFNLIEV
jgi:hypothetical protein